MNGALIAAVFAALAAVWGTFEFYGTAKATQGDPYRIADLLSRYSTMLGHSRIEQLPPDAVISHAAGEPAGDVKSQVLFNSAQYALAPRLIVTKPGQAWVMRNDESGMAIAKAGN
ncbi:MAG: hypothetical protein U0Q16_08680 [Bryobacteraceae bacterium]